MMDLRFDLRISPDLLKLLDSCDGMMKVYFLLVSTVNPSTILHFYLEEADSECSCQHEEE